jgi:hypothetical protein
MLVNPRILKFQRLLALAAGRELANLSHCRNSTILGLDAALCMVSNGLRNSG